MSNKQRKFRITFTVAALLLLAIAVFVTSIFGNFTGARVDLTSDKLYTMSPSAAKILGELKVPVQVKYYVTPEDGMPTEWRNLERDVTDKLRDYERVSGGMLEWSIYNPQDDEEMQTDLTSKGIRPLQVQSVEKDAIGVKLVWSALTIAYKDYPQEILPQVVPQSLANMEYELISRVYRLTNEEKPKIAIYAPPRPVNQQLAMMYLQQGMQPPEPEDIYTSVRQLLQEEHYDVVPIDLTQESGIPADTDVLVVLNPANLNERQAFEVNRALSNGLPTVIAIQNHTYDYQPAARGGFNFSAVGQTSGLETMLAQFGLTVSGDHFFDANLQVLEVPRQTNLGGLRLQTREPVRAPIQIQVTETQMNSESALTNRIGTLLYLWGTHLEVNESELARQELELTTLMTSSERSWSEPYNDGAVPGSYLNPSNKEFLGPVPLGVLVEGEFPDAFAGRSVPEWPADPTAPADSLEQGPVDTVTPLAAAPTKLVLFGCAKMFDDAILGAGQNPLLLLNTVDALAHGEDLISIRSKMLTQRIIKPAGDNEKLAYRIFVVVVVPVALALFGIIRAAMRRKEAALYRQHLLQTRKH